MNGPCIDVLVPSCGRPAALAVTLASVAAQDWPALRVVVSDQTEGASALGQPEVVAVLRYLRARHRRVETWHHLPRRGMAEQRAFLLAQARAPYSLFVDDDVILEPDLVTRLHEVIAEHGCGFAGSAVHGLSYLGQSRPDEEGIAYWEGRVAPETVAPGGEAWERHRLHNAANLFHLQERLRLMGGDVRVGDVRVGDMRVGDMRVGDMRVGDMRVGDMRVGDVRVGDMRPDELCARDVTMDGVRAGDIGAGKPSARPTRVYKVAWVGGCVLFHTAKLRAAGGFDFWPRLPAEHCGEDVLAQLRVMRTYGGCGILPSGAYHMELRTTLADRKVDAPYVPDLYQERSRDGPDRRSHR